MLKTSLATEMATVACTSWSCAASPFMYCAVCDSNVKYTLAFWTQNYMPTHALKEPHVSLLLPRHWLDNLFEIIKKTTKKKTPLLTSNAANIYPTCLSGQLPFSVCLTWLFHLTTEHKHGVKIWSSKLEERQIETARERYRQWEINKRYLPALCSAGM